MDPAVASRRSDPRESLWRWIAHPRRSATSRRRRSAGQSRDRRPIEGPRSPIQEQSTTPVRAFPGGFAEERIDPFGRRPQDGPHHPAKPGRASAGRIGPTRVHGVDRDAARVRSSEAASPLAHEGDRARFALARVPEYVPMRDCRSSRSRRWAYMPPDVTAMTRPLVRRRRWSSPDTARMGRRPSWRTSLRSRRRSRDGQERSRRRCR